MTGRRFIRPLALSALLVLLALSAFPVLSVLSFRDAKSGALLLALPSRPGMVLELAYTHSVNKGAIIDRYQLAKDGALVLKSAVFEEFGAGMRDGFEPDALFTTTEAGLAVDELDSRIGTLFLAVGTVADHRAYFDGREIVLVDIAEPGAAVRLSGERISVWEGLLSRRRRPR